MWARVNKQINKHLHGRAPQGSIKPVEYPGEGLWARVHVTGLNPLKQREACVGGVEIQDMDVPSSVLEALLDVISRISTGHTKWSVGWRTENVGQKTLIGSRLRKRNT
jgi:hypothetical protein